MLLSFHLFNKIHNLNNTKKKKDRLRKTLFIEILMQFILKK